MEPEKIELIISISLVISMILNGLLVWYAIKVLEKLSYEMEMYYGDPTLGALIKHSQLIVEQYTTFNEILEDLEDGIISVQEDVTEEPQEETDGEKEIG